MYTHAAQTPKGTSATNGPLATTQQTYGPALAWPSTDAQRVTQAQFDTSSRVRQAAVHQRQLNDSPLARAGAALAMSGPSQQARPAAGPGSTAVIQRFSVLANGDKESATGEIILNGEKNLFASNAMLGQANGIAGSQISFEHKADVKKNKHDANLRKIVPVVKPETGLAKSVAHFTNGGTPPAGRMLPNQDHNVELKRQMDQQKELATGGRDQAAIAQEALNKYNVKHATLLTLDTWYAKEEADENDDQELIEEMNALIETEGEARETAAAEMPDEDERVAAQLGYNTSVRSALATHATILPTDCGIMSQCISGEKQTMDEATHAVGVPADTLPAAGQAYHLTPKEPEDENNSWGSHHATVVMADGGDHVALEGAAHKATDNHLKVSLDDSWYFNMYGSEAEQSIANTYAADFPQGVDVTRTKRAPAA